MHDQRKREHLRISLKEDVGFRHLTAGFERYRFVHQALPELDWDSIDLSVEFLGHRLAAPLLISPMTGGTPQAEGINRRLAQAAQARGIGMSLGSVRAAIEDPSLTYTYQVRDVAPDAFLVANLGAVQLNYGYGLDECRRAVEITGADALCLHLNPLQEALQEGGNRNWAGLLRKIEAVCRGLEVPVLAKEVGWGISGEVARQLAQAGVAAIDVAGAGGTTWALVEMHRATREVDRRLAETFAEWGIPTAECIAMVRDAAPGVPIIASGGIYDGITAAKALALGASLVGMARPFLHAAQASAEAVEELVDQLVQTLRVVMLCLGAPNVAALQGTPHLRRVE
ncbi:MAG: type 2 isopentenyl-diphosphate Delta-isomerase [Anaerolineae bacterium]|nr:type 2 isopentenyl-diphosphate Delta-isomerase [Anaerolineae bacterium]